MVCPIYLATDSNGFVPRVKMAMVGASGPGNACWSKFLLSSATFHLSLASFLRLGVGNGLKQGGALAYRIWGTGWWGRFRVVELDFAMRRAASSQISVGDSNLGHWTTQHARNCPFHRVVGSVHASAVLNRIWQVGLSAASYCGHRGAHSMLSGD